MSKKYSHSFIKLGKSIICWNRETDRDFSNYIRASGNEDMSFMVLCHIARLLEGNLQASKSIINRMDCCGGQLARIEKLMKKPKKKIKKKPR